MDWKRYSIYEFFLLAMQEVPLRSFRFRHSASVIPFSRFIPPSDQGHTNSYASCRRGQSFIDHSHTTNFDCIYMPWMISESVSFWSYTSVKIDMYTPCYNPRELSTGNFYFFLCLISDISGNIGRIKASNTCCNCLFETIFLSKKRQSCRIYAL